jgi:uncharacterized protein (TIGR00369 family)
MEHVAEDPAFAERVRASFARQHYMVMLGARVLRVEPGLCEIELDWRADLVQQHGYLHAGVTTSIADSAGGYAAYTLMPAGSSVLAIELKVNLLEPARGQRFIARGRVLRAGRRLSVCSIGVDSIVDGRAERCLEGLQTVMCLRDQPDDPSRA